MKLIKRLLLTLAIISCSMALKPIDCVICFDPICIENRCKSEWFANTNCPHQGWFHSGCLKLWQVGHNPPTCPICDQELHLPVDQFVLTIYHLLTDGQHLHPIMVNLNAITRLSASNAFQQTANSHEQTIRLIQLFLNTGYLTQDPTKRSLANQEKECSSGKRRRIFKGFE